MTDFNSKDLTNLLFDSIEGKAEIIPIMTDEDMSVDKNLAVPDVLPILPLKNAILFPGVVLPITVGREQSIRLLFIPNAFTNASKSTFPDGSP